MNKISKWASTDEFLPESGEQVLAFVRDWKRMVQQSWEEHTDSTKEKFKQSFSHWRKLPLRPDEETEPKSNEFRPNFEFTGEEVGYIKFDPEANDLKIIPTETQTNEGVTEEMVVDFMYASDWWKHGYRLAKKGAEEIHQQFIKPLQEKRNEIAFDWFQLKEEKKKLQAQISSLQSEIERLKKQLEERK